MSEQNDIAREREQRKWKRELEQSKAREDRWHKTATGLYKRYRGEERRRNSFNLLWANTEILRPSVYNSVPTADVRRRFRDADPVGKAVSEVMERCLAVAMDGYGFECGTRADVLDSLIVGRGLSRVRYVPSFAQVGVTEAQHDAPGGEAMEEPSHEAHEDTREELEYEQATFEHVDWQDFRHGYGRTWDEVPWSAFRCKLDRADVIERFGEDVGNAITYDQVRDDENKQQGAETESRRVAEFWEIWDKAKKRVFFVQENYPALIFPLANPEGEPPLKFAGFFPIPEPLRMVEDSSSLLPIPLFTLYQEQADEVDRLSARINKIINALKVRGVYDATLSEIGDLMNGEDNDLVPVSKAAAWKDAGGFDKAIWWMPVEKSAQVLRELILARNEAKAVIYEITGISDIVRGASNAGETATAQQIKSQYASVRRERMRSEVARYVRDLIRLAAEVIGEKFAPETLATMTGLQFPTVEMKQQLQKQIQQAAQMQQPADPKMGEMLKLPTWEDITQVMRSDAMRQYRVDIETSSTVASSIESDMSGLREVLQGLIEFWAGSGPSVQAGALPIEAVKAISLAIVRRARMGLEVEDSIDQIKAPEQQGDPRAAQMQAEQAAQQQKQQAEQQAEQHRMQMEQARMEADAAIAQARAQADVDLARARAEAEIQLARERMQMEMALKREEMMERLAIERFKAETVAQAAAVKAEAAAPAPAITEVVIG